jgi:uncharacterized iron-regulated protein
MMNRFLIAVASFAFWAVPVWAAPVSEELLSDMMASDVVILGEIHDNPAHHQIQQEVVAAIRPKAVVWEMLTEVDAGRITSVLITDPERMAQVLRWAQSGWPEFAMYYPIFKAAPEARIYGGNVPREAAVAAMQAGPAVAFGADAARYGLTIPLTDDEQTARENHQMAVHCDALPASQLAPMVSIQRLRDAVLARAVLTALEETGGPVAVITGNGHARKDWGIPVYLVRMQPTLRVFAVGQSEAGQLDGQFDAVIDSPAVDRADPCDAFRLKG